MTRILPKLLLVALAAVAWRSEAAVESSNNNFFGTTAGNMSLSGCCNSFFGGQAGNADALREENRELRESLETLRSQLAVVTAEVGRLSAASSPRTLAATP
jgi:hypothetical protein